MLGCLRDSVTSGWLDRKHDKNMLPQLAVPLRLGIQVLGWKAHTQLGSKNTPFILIYLLGNCLVITGLVRSAPLIDMLCSPHAFAMICGFGCVVLFIEMLLG